MWGTPTPIGFWQPGQVYVLRARAPGTLRTTQLPSAFSAARAYPAPSGRGGRRCLLGRRATRRFKHSDNGRVRLVVARCQVDYAGKLTAHLPMAVRLILVKADGSVSVHADDRAYKPLNWMSPPCTISVRPAPADLAATTAETDPELTEVWEVSNHGGDTLQIAVAEVLHDSSHDLGVDPGLRKDGVEKHLQALLAENPSALGDGWTLVQREYYTPIGPVDLVCRDRSGEYVAVEVKRRGEIDGVEQLTRYLELMRREPRFANLTGVLAAQQVKPQARVLAEDRGIGVTLVDYDALRGMDNAEDRLF